MATKVYSGKLGNAQVKIKRKIPMRKKDAQLLRDVRSGIDLFLGVLQIIHDGNKKVKTLTGSVKNDVIDIDYEEVKPDK